jgi:hypothetical protein
MINDDGVQRVDATRQRLVPREPRYVASEIE